MRVLPWGCLCVAVWLGAAASADAQPPIRIGASFSNTGTYAQLGQTVQRGHQLCVKHANEKGGVLGRKIEFTAEDDQSDVAKSVAVYERLLAQDKVDAVFSPFSSPITDAVAEVIEKHRKPMVACCAATTSIFKKGRKFVFMLISPAEVYLEGLIDTAAKRGLKTIAVIHEDTLFPKAITQGALELAKKRGIQAVLVEAYPRKTTDFSAILARVKAANPDVVAAATYFDDAVAIARQMKDLDVNPRMHAVTVGGDLPRFHEQLGRVAEFVYGASQWEPELVTLRAGGSCRSRASIRERASSSSPTGRNSRAPTSRIRPRKGTARARSCWRGSGAPAPSTARRSGTPSSKWTSTRPSARSRSTRTASRSRTRC